MSQVDFEFSVCGRSYPHNEKEWRVATNRHTNINGTDWGWIEGPDKNTTWSDDKTFNRAAASQVVKIHNQWLKDQEPLSIKIVKAQRETDLARKNFDEKSAEFDKANDRFLAAKKHLEHLQGEKQNG